MATLFILTPQSIAIIQSTWKYAVYLGSNETKAYLGKDGICFRLVSNHLYIKFQCMWTLCGTLLTAL